jgi:hypothetical protein
MSVPMPKPVPKSRLSLSVMSNFPRLSADAVLESRVFDGDLAAIAGQVEAEQISSEQICPRRATDQVAFILRSEVAAADEADGCRAPLRISN